MNLLNILSNIIFPIKNSNIYIYEYLFNIYDLAYLNHSFYYFSLSSVYYFQ